MSSYANSAELQQQQLPILMPAEDVAQRSAGQSHAAARLFPQMILDRHQGSAAEYADHPGPAPAAGNHVSETACLNQEQQQSEQVDGIIPRMEPQRGPQLDAQGMGMPWETGAAPGQAVTGGRLGSLGSTGRPATSAEVSPAQLFFGDTAAETGRVDAAEERLESRSPKHAGRLQNEPVSAAAVAAETGRLDAAEAAVEGMSERDARRLRWALPAIAAAAAAGAVGGGAEECSSGSHKGKKWARGVRERVFAALEPQLPSSLSGPAGYTDTFAFPAADAAAAVSRAAPEDTNINNIPAEEVNGGRHVTAESAPTRGQQIEVQALSTEVFEVPHR